MAEQPQGFARRMMAQKLMTDARNTPGSDSPFFAGRIRPSMADMEQPTRFSDMAMPAYSTGATASLFAPGAGVVDIFGGAPDPMQPGQMLPSFGENIGQGNYLDAGLQTLGAAGDVALAAGALFPPALPAAAALGTALKAPRAAKVADAAMDAADAAKVDPNQAAGAAMDLAQARYFDTGKFEPPTAENPVSVVLPTETEPGIIAFHGSGADFDEFRLEMIGTGEGAQAYGYGLYFTDSEDIAKFYRDTVSTGDAKIPYGSAEDAAQAVPDNVPYVDLDGYRSYSIVDAEKVLESVLTKQYGGDPPEPSIVDFNLEILKKSGVLNAEMPDGTKASLLMNQAGDQFTLTPVKKQTGKMYKVGLAPKPDELLDYDLPLSQQPKKYKAALDEIAEIHGIPVVDQFGQSSSFGAFQDALIKRFESQDFQNELYGRGNRLASELMAKAGIPGIKYRASGSRGAGTTDEAAERNYVIFDDKAVKILEKYGIAGPVLVTGAAVAASKAGNDNEDGGSILPDAGII